jgi:hypothetical protein
VEIFRLDWLFLRPVPGRDKTNYTLEAIPSPELSRSVGMSFVLQLNHFILKTIIISSDVQTSQRRYPDFGSESYPGFSKNCDYEP